MKLNKNKIIMSAMLTLIGSSMIGSIAGTVAWYQYSTRASTSYVGASAKCTELLEVKIGDGDFKTNLSSTDVINYLKAQTRYSTNPDKTAQLVPVTAGAQAKDDDLNTLKGNPSYLISSDYAKWNDASDTDYVTFPLTFRLRSVDGEATPTLLSKDLFLTDLLLQEDASNATGKEDISDALRVHLSCGTKNFLLAKDAAIETTTFGPLDLDGKDGVDKASTRGTAYSFETLSDFTYGTADSKEYAYKLSDIAPTDTARNGVLTGGNALGTIPSTGTLDVNVTIFLEGWQKLASPADAVWDASKYIGSMFDVGMTFAVTK